MKRREFIKITGLGATSASLLSACGHPEEKLIPAWVPDEEYVPGIDYWKASTCGMCSAGCGIIVRTREHKANKIEGNPLHPVNRGALCARGQAGLEVLYNPDRIKGPMKRVGERGEGKWAEISWDEGIKTLADTLRQIKANGEGDKIAFATRCPDSVTGLAAELLASSLGARMILLSDVARNTGAMSGVAGSGLPPFKIFDIANATYLFSLGARFLETWESPVRYSLAFGEFRRSKGNARGRFIHAEPRMSLTASNADMWLPIKAGSEQVLALSVAEVIVREKLFPSATTPSFLEDNLDDYAPEKTAEIAGLDPDRIIRLAREFASSTRPLAIGEGPAIEYLNHLAGNINKPGGMMLAAGLRFDSLKPLRDKLGLPEGTGFVPTWILTTNREAPSLIALLIHEWNPRFSTPEAVGRLDAIPFVASFSAFMDETTAAADLILPDHSPLEIWDLIASPIDDKRVALTISQPVVTPQFNTRQTADALISVSREVGGAGSSTPFESAEEIVRTSLDALKTAASEVVERGFTVIESPNESSNRESDSLPSFKIPTSNEPNNSNYPLALLIYEHVALGKGERAHIAALQELPDPMTSVIWGSWVEINPKTASSLGIGDGDLIKVETEHGAAQVPAVLYPAIRPDLIAMPQCQGHTAYGRYATGRGVNVASLGASYQETVPARITRIEGKSKVIRFGTDLWQQMEKKR